MPPPTLPTGLTTASPETHTPDHEQIHQRVNNVPTFQETFRLGDTAGVPTVQIGNYIWMPERTIEILAVRSILGVVASSGSTIVDCNTVNLTTGIRTSIFTSQSDRPTIVSSTRSVSTVLSVPVTVDGQTVGITVDIDQVGIGALFLMVTILYRRA